MSRGIGVVFPSVLPERVYVSDWAVSRATAIYEIVAAESDRDKAITRIARILMMSSAGADEARARTASLQRKLAEHVDALMMEKAGDRRDT